MKKQGTRRGFLGAVSAAAVAPSLSLAKGKSSAVATDYYDKLGVTKIINAAGTYTFLTASLMPPEVQLAVL